jgi:thiaminase
MAIRTSNLCTIFKELGWENVGTVTKQDAVKAMLDILKNEKSFLDEYSKALSKKAFKKKIGKKTENKATEDIQDFIERETEICAIFYQSINAMNPDEAQAKQLDIVVREFIDILDIISKL